jgi:2-phosphosulfolactate phosphatase
VQVEMFSTVGEVRSEELIGKTVIVLDILRATSCIVTAIAHGCEKVIPMETLGQVKLFNGENVLLGGERFCKKIQGFDFGNSPLEYDSADIKQRTIIMTTTNGTRAIHKSLKGESILIGSFLNGEACAKRAVEIGRDVVLVCSGTKDRYALEDGLCAGYIAESIRTLKPNDVYMGDLAKTMQMAYTGIANFLTDTLLASESGRRLSKLGFGEDVNYCSQRGRYDVVPIVHTSDTLEIRKD